MSSLRDPGFAFRTTYGAEDDRLRGFFIPALERSVRYDRATGYFTSSALVSVARGLVGFLQNNGRMRLLAGAQLSAGDVEALEGGRPLEDVLVQRLLSDPIEGANLIAKRRLEVLAWMVREDRLEMRIAVRLDKQGRPLSGAVVQPYFHKKTAIFHDQEGNRMALLGSNNESAMGLDEEGNAEEFAVYPSWFDEVWPHYGQPVLDRFESEWNGNLKQWRVLPLPEAVREHLIRRVNFHGEPPYESDEDLERETRPPPVGRGVTGDFGIVRSADPADVQRLRELRDAPRQDGGTGVGIVTAPVEPWPHQRRIAHRVTSTYPRSYLFADEVGMGKTIEAGLVFRELLLSGNAERILILVPASVIKQWQEELAEKFLLRVPRLDRGAYWYRSGGEDEAAIPSTPGGNPWAAFPVLLASSHLARTRKRRQEVLAAGPWDVVFVDEAHHARRRGGKEDATPNALLALLQAMKAANTWKALYLASATPMQMHAHEAWDLLELLGLTPRWGAGAAAFAAYFEQLRQPGNQRDWHFLQSMLADHLSDPENVPNEHVIKRVRERAPGLRGKRIIHYDEEPINVTTLTQLPADEIAVFDDWLRENTPMRRRVFRTTRTTLQEYKRTGLLDPDTVIPERHVEDAFIDMNPDEAQLYRRIENYIGRYYNRYKNMGGAQRALGFIMTVYRRRLTSSFEAITQSLRKRRQALDDDDNTLAALLDEDDLSAIETTGMFDLEDLENAKLELAREADELGAFLRDLERLPPDESKMLRLQDELRDAIHRGHRTAIVFTQYGDTMHYIARKLTGTFGSAVATWSGGGGARWNPSTRTWAKVPKPVLKDLFRAGDEVKILIGTDSMSEGLNLQSCAFLVNYDMPWNFMRVEQRIGRIDRIGGQPRVEVRNYFYRDTVEQQIYEGLAEDIDWFESVVGPARPVLGQIESIIEDAAMRASEDERGAGVREAIKRVRDSVENAKSQPVQLDEVTAGTDADDPNPAVTLLQLRDELLGNPLTGPSLVPDPSTPGAFRLAIGNDAHTVTFDRSTADRAGEVIHFLTYGSEWLGTLFELGLAGTSEAP